MGILGRRRAIDVMDYLEGKAEGARFKDVQKHAANGVPSIATGLLTALEKCGAVAKDDSNDFPRYRLTRGGESAREFLHRAEDALGAGLSTRARSRRRRTRSGSARSSATGGDT